MMIYVSDSPMWRNIRYLRRRQKMSLRQLSRLTQIPCRTLLRFEMRLLLDIDYDDLLCLCRTLGVNVEELIETDLRKSHRAKTVNH